MTHRPGLGLAGIHKICLLLGLMVATSADAAIPLPEHPRPDFQRTAWMNLNGTWDFRADPKNEGLNAKWFEGGGGFSDRITVPFSWEAPLSGVTRRTDFAWYRREIEVPADWTGKQVFLVIGACDWGTEVWLDGKSLGTHEGGYTPFEFELTPHIKPGGKHRIDIRVEDVRSPDRLVGKQGYGNARGIWQTVYLEARPAIHLQTLRFLPDVPAGKVTVIARLNQKSPSNTRLYLKFREPASLPGSSVSFPAGASEHRFDVTIPNARLWRLEDPYLHELDATLDAGGTSDTVSTYFGFRSIGVTHLPGTDYPWVALNGKPIYLQMVLDQAYHPKGHYTFPTDEDLRREIILVRRLGLNTTRFHVKVEAPRKLYWADRLGVLVMADVPHGNDDPTDAMKRDWYHAWRGMLQRDFNHPSIFSWILFNETWGLGTQTDTNNRSNWRARVYLPETQAWVQSLYREAKRLDPTRLIEDNSQFRKDHVETDINSFHRYAPGYEWRKWLTEMTEKNFPGSTDQFIGGRKLQPNTPLINSECGNVWGYDGGTGDIDYSWDYHCMMNEFRRFPEIAGWLYTELHDVPNEWNGYYRYDRSDKFTGLDELMPGMTLNDFHAPLYISSGQEICRDAKPGETVNIPLWASFLTDTIADTTLTLRAELGYWDGFGIWHDLSVTNRTIAFQPWLSRELDPLPLRMPAARGLALVRLQLLDATGAVLHRNFTAIRLSDGETPRVERTTLDGQPVHVLRFAPAAFTSAKWSLKQWNILDGLKVNGAGHGYFEYRIPWPEDLDPSHVTGGTLRFEASAKRLLGKDREARHVEEQVAVQGTGGADSGASPNAYPMTDTRRDPSLVRVTINGESLGSFDLDDDPADHRGLLSWHAQLRDRKLREAGSYGYLINAALTPAALKSAAEAKELVVRLEVPAALPGGLAIYGERSVRYPLDPTLILIRKP
jgi:hypothetical protein